MCGTVSERRSQGDFRVVCELPRQQNRAGLGSELDV